MQEEIWYDIVLLPPKVNTVYDASYLHRRRRARYQLLMLAYITLGGEVIYKD